MYEPKGNKKIKIGIQPSLNTFFCPHKKQRPRDVVS